MGRGDDVYVPVAIQVRCVQGLCPIGFNGDQLLAAEPAGPVVRIPGNSIRIHKGREDVHVSIAIQIRRVNSEPFTGLC